jgi:hypothetical protein
MVTGHAAATVAGMMFGALMAAGDSYADPTPVATIVLHVTDYQHVPPRRLAEAQKLAAAVYNRIGVKLVWTDGVRSQAAADGCTHVDMVILDRAMSDRSNPDPTAEGQASHATKRAAIYYPRVVNHAAKTQSDPTRALAVVLAHELGHVLLPAYSHTREGLMRASSEGRVVKVPNFATHQADTIRALAAQQ